MLCGGGWVAQATGPVAFSAVANGYQGVDPSTVFDLNGDLVGDIKVSGNMVSRMAPRCS